MEKFYIDFEANIDNTILTIGVVSTKGYQFSLGIKPQNPIHWTITKLTGITEEDTKEFVTLEEAAQIIQFELLDHVGGARLYHYGKNDKTFAKTTLALFEKNTFGYGVFKSLAERLVNLDHEISKCFTTEKNTVSLRNAYATICRDCDLVPDLLHEEKHDAYTDAVMLRFVDDFAHWEDFHFNERLGIVRIPKIFKQSTRKIVAEEDGLKLIPVEDRNRSVWVGVVRKDGVVKITNFKNLYSAVGNYRGNSRQGKISVMVQRAHKAATEGTMYMGRKWSFSELTLDDMI